VKPYVCKLKGLCGGCCNSTLVRRSLVSACAVHVLSQIEREELVIVIKVWTALSTDSYLNNIIWACEKMLCNGCFKNEFIMVKCFNW